MSGSVTSTKQFVGAEEERDGAGAVVSQFVARGQKTNNSKYFYKLTGHCNSITSVSDNSGTEVTTINYTPYGSPSIALASFIPDFGYAGYYLHQRSGLNLTRYRAYNPSLGRWICRDPAGPQGSNLHGYANNNPVCFTDPSGLTTQVCCSDFTRAEIRNLTDQIAVHAHMAVINVSNRTSTFMDLFIGGSENTLFGNRVDREFKFLVTRDVSLGRHPLNIHANYGAGPDITTDCPDIFWEITSIGAAPAHYKRLKPLMSDKTPPIFEYGRYDLRTGALVDPDPFW